MMQSLSGILNIKTPAFYFCLNTHFETARPWCPCLACLAGYTSMKIMQSFVKGKTSRNAVNDCELEACWRWRIYSFHGVRCLLVFLKRWCQIIFLQFCSILLSDSLFAWLFPQSHLVATIIVLNEVLQQDGHRVCYNLMCVSEAGAMEGIPKDGAVSGDTPMATTCNCFNPSAGLVAIPLSSLHDDVIKWKHFPRYWPFVRRIHQPRWIPRTKASDAELWCFLWSAPE